MNLRSPFSRREDVVGARADRLVLLQGLRVLMALTVLGAAALGHDVVGFRMSDVARLTGFYVFASVATEVGRRTGRVLAAGTVYGMLVVDAIYISLVLFIDDGPRSLLVFLVYLHLIAVTLLTTYRTGVKLAVWYSAVLFAVDGLHAAGVLDGIGHGRFSSPASELAFLVVSFWMVTGCTAALAAVNERELRRGQAELRALAHMGARLEHVDGPEDAARVLLEAVLGTFSFRRGAIVAGTDDGWWALGSPNSPVVPLNRGRPIRPDGVIARAWETRTALPVKGLNPEDDPVFNQLLPRATNVLVLPLIADGRPFGALALEWGGYAGARIPVPVVTTVTQFAAHAALSLRNAWLHAEVERLATFDALTGLLNRRVFEKVLQREVERSWRSSQPVSLIVFDVDHFKKVNDTYGHQAGDDVLRHVGRVLREHGRGVDVAARYGGEEFAVILPGCAPADAVAVAERLREAIATYDGPLAVTCSAGVAGVPLNASDGASLVAAADQALYASKAAGRDSTTRSRRRRRGLRPVGEPLTASS